jgi:cyclic pyranopterin monophosphate synthase
MSDLSHIDASGAAKMVDVGHKPETARMARATGRIDMSAQAFHAVRTNAIAKGDVLAAARLAGIMAAKKTSDLIPLCHPLPLSSVAIEFSFGADSISVEAVARTTAQTGVEMEALTAVSVALLTIYDMAKAVDKSMRIEAVRLLEKTGGKSGNWRA